MSVPYGLIKAAQVADCINAKWHGGRRHVDDLKLTQLEVITLGAPKAFTLLIAVVAARCQDPHNWLFTAQQAEQSNRVFTCSCGCC